MQEQLELFDLVDSRTCSCCSVPLVLGAYKVSIYKLEGLSKDVECFDCIRISSHGECKKCYQHCKCVPHPLTLFGVKYLPYNDLDER